MKGTANLHRLDFGLGQGDWASTEWVGDEVEVRFELKLRPVAPATIS
jgi:polyisoprenoid-binding protein YceI